MARQLVFVMQNSFGRISIFEGVFWARNWYKQGMSNCCLNSVPQSDSSFETFGCAVADWTARLTAGLERSVRASDQTPGQLEEEILHLHHEGDGRGVVAGMNLRSA